MALATLSIDLVAKLASLEAGMDKASRIAERNAKQIERHFNGIKNVAIGVGAALGAAFSVTQITQFALATVNSLDALNDLKDATGSSIENISALEDVALRTGTSFESMAGALVKLNKALIDAKPGSDTADVLSRIGLSAEELKRIDPAEAMLKVSKALAKFADDGDKARAVQVLFGRSIQEVAPLLKDLAEKGELVATVTTEQAEAAETFNKQLAELRKNSQDTARSLLSDLVPALNEVFKNLKKEGFGGAVLAGARLDPLSRQRKDLENLNLEITKTGGKLSEFIDAQKKDPYNPAYAERITTFRAELERLTKQADAASEALKAAANTASPLPAGEPIWSVGFQSKESIGGGKTGGSKTAGKAPRLTSGAGFSQSEISAREHDEQLAAQLAEIDAVAQHSRDLMDEQINATADWHAKLNDEAAKLPEDFKKAADQMDEFAKQAARNIQDSLGDTLYDVLKGDFDNIEDKFGDMLLRMAADAAAAQIGNYLFGDMGKTSWGAIGTIGASILSGGTIPAFATGTPFVPEDTLAFVHKGERITPAAANRRDGGGTAATVVNQTNYIDSRTDQAQVAQIASEAALQAVRAYDQARQAQGRA